MKSGMKFLILLGVSHVLCEEASWSEQSIHSSSHSATAKAAENNASTKQRPCFEVQDSHDIDELNKLDIELMNLNTQFGSNPDVLEKQSLALIEKRIGAMSAQTRQALNAQFLMHDTAATLSQIQSDPALSGGLIAFQAALNENDDVAEKYSHSGAFSVLFGSGTKVGESADKVTAAAAKLNKAIQSSPTLDSVKKRQFSATLGKLAQQSLGNIATASDKVLDRIQVQKELTKAVRDTSIGAGLTVGGLILTGGSASGGGISLTASSAARLGATSLNLLRSTAGFAAIAGGARLAAGTTGNIIRSLASDGDFFCNLAHEQKNNSKLLYAEAASAAKRGAVYGGIFGWGRIAQLAGGSGVARQVLSNWALWLEGIGSVTREVDRSSEGMKKLAAGIESDKPSEKISAIKDYYSSDGFSSERRVFRDLIEDKISSDKLQELGPKKAKQVNDLLDGIIVGLSREDSFGTKRFNSLYPKGNLPSNAGEAAMIKRYAADVGVSALGAVTTFPNAAEGLSQFYTAEAQLKLAAKKLDSILESP